VFYSSIIVHYTKGNANTNTSNVIPTGIIVGPIIIAIIIRSIIIISYYLSTLDSKKRSRGLKATKKSKTK